MAQPFIQPPSESLSFDILTLDYLQQLSSTTRSPCLNQQVAFAINRTVGCILSPECRLCNRSLNSVLRRFAYPQEMLPHHRSINNFIRELLRANAVRFILMQNLIGMGWCKHGTLVYWVVALGLTSTNLSWLRVLRTRAVASGESSLLQHACSSGLLQFKWEF